MIYASGLNYGEKQEEMLEMDQMKYPYACYYRTMDTRFQSTVSWHWHKSIEIDYIMEGELVLTWAVPQKNTGRYNRNRPIRRQWSPRQVKMYKLFPYSSLVRG